MRVSLFFSLIIIDLLIAQMVELVDTLVSGTSGFGCASSSLVLGTFAQVVELVDMLL